ncbi:MAG TPA: exosortase/archaeosortase family protein [Planctomycetota bacterium]
MGRQKKSRREARAAEGPGPGPGAPAAAGEAPEGLRAAKGPALRFVLVVAALMALFYGVFYTSPEENPGIDRLIRAYLGVYASAGAFLFDLVGLEAQARGTTLFVDAKAVEVVRGCDAMEPIAFFVAAVVALQVPLRAKLIGLGAGVPLLMLLNLLRIMALALISARMPQVFETAHITVGQTVFVVCTLCLWFAWALRATRVETERAVPAG